MVWRNIHTHPFSRSRRDVLPLLRAYYIPVLVLSMIACFAAGFTCFLVRAVSSLRFVRASLVVPSVAETFLFRYGLTTYLCVGGALFFLLFWSFFQAMCTSPGYVPSQPWSGVPRFDRHEQRRVSEQWAKQQQWLEWNRYQQAMMQYQWRMRLLQQMMGVSAPVMHLQPPAKPAPAVLAVPVADSSSLSSSHLYLAQSGKSLTPAPGGPKVLSASSVAFTVNPNGNGSDCSTSSTSHHSSSSSSSSSGDTAAGVTHGKPARRSDLPNQAPHVAVTVKASATATAPQPSSCTDNRPGGETNRRVTTAVPPHALISAPPACSVNTFTVHELEADGTLRYCHVCSQYKPDRSHHCRYCGRCTALMDHHCLYLNNCVGLRNYKFFFLTITYGTACGWLCSAMFLHAFVAIRSLHTTLQGPVTYPPSFNDGYQAFLQQVRESRSSVDFSVAWLLTPASMLLVNAFVFFLFCQHVGLLRRGVTTLERMRQISVERFVRSMNIQRYGRCAPQTNRLCAIIADARERARCLIHRVHSAAQDEDAEYAKMLARDEAASRGLVNGGLDYAYGPNLSESCAGRNESHGSNTTLGQEDGVSERRSRHFRRLFGSAESYLDLILPLMPYDTGEQPGEAEMAPEDTKFL